MARLRALSITTVEEFVGAIDADAHALATYLDLSDVAVGRLRNDALMLLAPQRQEALAKPPPRRSLGAVKPDELDRSD